MDLKENLVKVIESALKESGLVEDIPQIKIEIPKDKSNGDFSTNIAMALTRVLKRNPREIAQEIVNHIDKEAGDIREIDIAGPGFINFKMNEASLTKIIDEVLDKKENYGRSDSNGEKVLLEFVSANPTGSLHIGHARNAAVGDTLANILDFAGYSVTREYYINDAGNQIYNLALSINARYFEADRKSVV